MTPRECVSFQAASVSVIVSSQFGSMAAASCVACNHCHSDTFITFIQDIVLCVTDGDLGHRGNVVAAYMKQKHRMIWERRHGPVGSGGKTTVLGPPQH